MIDPEPPRTRMNHRTLRSSSSSSAHGLPGRFASCVLDLLGPAVPRARGGSEPIIYRRSGDCLGAARSAVRTAALSTSLPTKR
jgi:hypothetical protein